MIMDRHGKVLVWYLPGILIGRLVSFLYLDMSCCLDIIFEEIMTATRCIPCLLKKSVFVDPERKAPWRCDTKNFVRPAEEAEFEAGSVDFSQSWFQARKEVSGI
jgi:hypothetical protein